MSRLRIAVMGAGHLGRIHARLLKSQPDVEIVGIVDPVSAVRESVAAELQIATFAHHSELAGQFDAAIIATVTTQHHPVGADLLRAGIHLFIEKPLAATLAEADELVTEAEERRLVLQVGHVERFNPAIVAVRRHLSVPLYIEAKRTSSYSGRSTDVGVVLDLMIHDIDLAIALAQSEVVDVQSLGAAVFGPHEDLAQARVTFASGCVVNLSAARTSFVNQRTMQIFCSDRFANLDFATGEAQLVRASERVCQGVIQIENLTSAERGHLRDNLFNDYLPLEKIEVEKRNAIFDEHRDFVAAIREQRQPQVSGAAGRRALALCEQIVGQINCWRAQHQNDSLNNKPLGTPEKAIPFHISTAPRRKAG